MTAGHELGDQPDIRFGLTDKQELFLFGDQGEITDENRSFAVGHYKMGLAREWLASFVPIGDVPTEIIEERKQTDDEIRQYCGGGIETFGVDNPHPLAYALHVEQNRQEPFSDRPILSAVLQKASEALALEGDHERGQKIEYILALFAEYDRQFSNSGLQGGDSSPERFPIPVPSYSDEQFPIWLSDPALLDEENERFDLSPEDPKFSERPRNIAMVAIFGPAITGEVTMRNEGDAEDEQAPIEAVHSAISSILMRKFPESVEKRGLEKAIKEFDNGYGMRGGFPAPTSWIYDGRDPSQVKADAIAEGQAAHREAMAHSRYTITLGQVVRALMPYIEAFDSTTKEMFDREFPYSLSRAFQSVWRMLGKQDTHVEHFSDIMDWQYQGPDEPYLELPEPGEDHISDYLNQNFVMTEADVRRIFSEPIANAFQDNITTNGKLKTEAVNFQEESI